MEITTAVERLAALGHVTRLAIFRLLVQAGPQGINVGQIAERLEIALPTLSFHLAHLSRVGLIQGRPESRFIFYAADYKAMQDLLSYLTEHCCEGSRCVSRERSKGAPSRQRRAPTPR
jgi:ArsR family transcriptional regulator, arsenate/arsenite/antimonite-responsive transcriptional repressor